MIRLVLIAAAFAAGLPRPPQEKQAEHPPYSVTVTAKTGFAKWKDAYKEFEDRLKKILPGAKFRGSTPVPNDKAGWEIWRFDIAWDAKFDQSKFAKLFGEMKIGKIEMIAEGEADIDLKTRKITLTAFGEKIKLKLLNRPKQDFNDQPENRLAKFAEAFNGGKKFFRVGGEVVSSGDIWAIYLDEFSPVPEPKK